LGEATGHWHMAFLFDTLYQLIYMIYITNAKARIDILSIQQATGDIGCLLLTFHRRVLQRSQDPLVGWGWGGIWAVDSQENH